MKRNKTMLLFLIRLLFMFPMVGMYGCDTAWAQGIATNDAVLAILGESGPSLEEMRGIASALRNRKQGLSGVYGYKRVTATYRNAKTGHMYSEELIQRAYRAWANSEYTDYVGGADHWLSNWDLAHAKPRLTAFRHEMIETAYIGTTHFYKEMK